MEEEKQDKNKKNNSKINSNNQKETPEFHSEKYKKKSEYPNFLLKLSIWLFDNSLANIKLLSTKICNHRKKIKNFNAYITFKY